MSGLLQQGLLEDPNFKYKASSINLNSSLFNSQSTPNMDLERIIDWSSISSEILTDYININNK